MLVTFAMLMIKSPWMPWMVTIPSQLSGSLFAMISSRFLLMKLIVIQYMSIYPFHFDAEIPIFNFRYRVWHLFNFEELFCASDIVSTTMCYVVVHRSFISFRIRSIVDVS